MLDRVAIDAFHRDGFVVVRNLFDDARMGEIRSWIDALAQWPEVPRKYMMYFEQSLTDRRTRILSRVENFCPYHAGLQGLVNSPEMLGAVSELFGQPAVLFKDKINFKMAGGDGFKAHQDVQAGWDTYASLHITAMVSIDSTNVENGCLEMAAGHHQRGLIGKSWQPLEGSGAEGIEYVPYPTHAGDALFFDSYAPHRSAANRTASARRVLYITYNRASEGDHRARYYADKRKNYPPDCERDPEKEYVFRV
jgi:ectoine hydroxylase-related dioxygenase (phytanoyl-CoA dioxygenase family)